jgi:hypothetical protein
MQRYSLAFFNGTINKLYFTLIMAPPIIRINNGLINQRRKKMSAKERIRMPIPTSELERRWTKVRSAMKAAGIDCLIMQEDNRYRGGMIRYFIDIPPDQIL